MSRKGVADPASNDFLNREILLNNIKRVSINSGTERAWGVAIVDASGNQVVPNSVASGIGDGRQTVTTAGTRVQLSVSSVTCIKVTIAAETDNTDYIVVGGSTVVAALATRRGIPLGPGDTITIEISNLNLIYLDSLVNTEGVTYTYVT